MHYWSSALQKVTYHNNYMYLIFNAVKETIILKEHTIKTS